MNTKAEKFFSPSPFPGRRIACMNEIWKRTKKDYLLTDPILIYSLFIDTDIGVYSITIVSHITAH